MGRTYCRFRGSETAGLARANPPDGGFYRRLPIARCVSVCRKIRSPETSALSAKAAVGSTPKSSNLKIKNAMAKKIKGRPRMPIHAVPRVFKRWPPKLRHAVGYLIYTFCNWVKYDAKLVWSHNERIRSTAVCKTVKRKHGLTFSEGKENVRTGKLHGPDQVKYAAYEAVKTVLKGRTSLRKLAGRLKERGVTTRFIHRGGNPAEEVQGSIFTMNGQTFKASKADRKFSYANLCRTIERSRVVANTAKKVMERTEIDGRKISEYLTAGGRTGRTGRTNQGWTTRLYRRDAVRKPHF